MFSRDGKAVRQLTSQDLEVINDEKGTAFGAGGEFRIPPVGRALGESAAFRGLCVLITSGPTREAVDPVRDGILIGLLQLGRRAHEAALTSSRSIAVLRPASPLAENLAGIVQSRLGEADKASQHFIQARYRPERSTPTMSPRCSTWRSPPMAPVI